MTNWNIRLNLHHKSDLISSSIEKENNEKIQGIEIFDQYENKEED